jgi:hypothetical protein
VIESGTGAGRRLALSGDGQVLGRSLAAPLRLDDPHVSRRHARLTCRGGEVTVEDLGSRSGTLRNGRRLSRGAHRLAPGDEIAAGAVRLRLVAPLAADPAEEGAPGVAARVPGEPPRTPAGTRRPTRLASPDAVPARSPPARRGGWSPVGASAAALLLAACALSLALAALA